jgi:S-adenosyl-L-methionine hydrolase (adenosine-forming)
MPGLRFVTLSTDFGSVYAAQVKAVLLRGLAPGRLVELTDALPAHRIGEAAFLLRAMAERFPSPSIHLAVVDPGVGTDRAAVVIECRRGDLLVGPDNGLLAELADSLGARRSYRIERSNVRVPPAPSPTFDGRDLFAPAALALAKGTPPRRLGPPAPFEPSARAPARRTPRTLRGEVVHVDRFGNVITSIPGAWLPAQGTVGVPRPRRGARPLPIVRTYGELAEGALGVLVSSFGGVELGARQRSAADLLGLRVGASVELRLAPGPRRRRPRGTL